MTDEQLRRLLHDLRDPLSAVLAHLELLRARLPAAEADARAIAAEVDRLVALLDGAATEPAAPTGVPLGRIWDEHGHAVLRGCGRVLQVDDDDTTSPLRAVLVGRGGCEVDHVRSTADALDALDRDRFGLAVVDWWLGPATAESLLGELARLRVPTVVLSGDAGTEEPARRHGAGFVRKPAPLRAVLDALAGAVGRGSL